jgi:hypothetical protein
MVDLNLGKNFAVRIKPISNGLTVVKVGARVNQKGIKIIRVTAVVTDDAVKNFIGSVKKKFIK